MAALLVVAELAFLAAVLTMLVNLVLRLQAERRRNNASRPAGIQEKFACRPSLVAWLPCLTRKERNADGRATSDKQTHIATRLETDDCEPVFLSGFAPDASCDVFLRAARRRPGRASSRVWLTIKHDRIGLLQLPEFPRMDAYAEGGVNGFARAALNVKCVDPLRVWKATYNGILRLKPQSVDAVPARDVHAKLSLRWSAFTGVAGSRSEYIAARSAGKAWERDTGACWCTSHWEQWGELQGSLYVEELGTYSINLRGINRRTLGCNTLTQGHVVIHYGRLKTGTVFQLVAQFDREEENTISKGYLIRPNGICEAITTSNLDLIDFIDLENLPMNYGIEFKTDCSLYLLECHVDEDGFFQEENDNQGLESLHRLASFKLNGTPGRGANEVSNRLQEVANRFCCVHVPTSPASPSRCLPFVHPVSPDLSTCGTPLALWLSDPMCCLIDITGGKASQLARLQAIATQFTVPLAFCLTTRALHLHLEENCRLKLLLNELQTAWRQAGNTEGNTTEIQSLHQRVEACFIQSHMSEHLKHMICSNYAQLQLGDALVALRSSAVGEDAEDSSAAGQMETYLNVQGVSSVLEHVLKCWASLYSYQAVQYRRQHGQGVLSKMAVIVQLMVPSETAGVLFTADPITGNPKSMLINASYGLGESVVSGQVTPDTMLLEKTSDQTVRLASMNVADSVTTSTTNRTDCNGCLVYDQVMTLANIGMKIESLFGGAVDIEWAEVQGQFYVLQVRPVTTLHTETDDELVHEFDTALASDSEWLTTCNIGEMMPGALTPLSQSVFGQAIEDALQNIQVSWGVSPFVITPTMKNLGIYSGCCFINLHTMSNTYENNVLIANKNVTELGLCGKVLDGLTWDMIKQHNGQASMGKRMKNAVNAVQYLWSGRHRLDELESLLATFCLERRNTAAEMYATITDHLSVYSDAWDTHMLFSAKSGMWNSTLVSTLCHDMDDLTADMSSDMSLLLSCCSGVVSADVPSALEDLADMMVHKYGVQTCRQFVQCEQEEALLWLRRTDYSVIRESFQQFLDKHGHRCLREAEFAAKPWAAEPSRIMPAIQALIKQRIDAEAEDAACRAHLKLNASISVNCAVLISSVEEGRNWPSKVEKTRQQNDLDDIFGKLKINLSWIKRKFIKWMLPKCREAVRQREKGKSLAVKMSNHFRQAYLHLGKLLVLEEYLPANELVFFLTQYEIGQLLCGDKSLVTKAMRRRKLYPSQLNTRYPIFNVGTPQPTNTRIAKSVAASFKMRGMPVSQGSVEGRARVVLDVRDATHIQPGEILITQCTDVGWTPYFTLIGGLVTELGGLLSHGAVVAREYGVPCIASVPGATDFINTGDLVRLDASLGTLTRICE